MTWQWNTFIFLWKMVVCFYFLKSVWLRAECLELFWFDKVFVCCGLILIWVFANFMIFSVRHFFHIQFHGFDFCCGELCISNLWFLLESLMCCVLIQFGISSWFVLFLFFSLFSFIKMRFAFVLYCSHFVLSFWSCFLYPLLWYRMHICGCVVYLLIYG